jgi:hypothetical protein
MPVSWTRIGCVFALGVVLMTVSTAYYITVNGFPIPVVDAASVTPEEMARINGPVPTLSTALWSAGLASLGAGAALCLVKSAGLVYRQLRRPDVRPDRAAPVREPPR